ncbi:hypothetical protein DPMN_094563 [Dreissena polymorpha]|uniref:Uncharacterized protein n=2 Tax=Dreissena polymorpha TaxID=45954 RepID=A0A9D4L4Y9_DREPO|nr:hypothetical protein DPMN_094563 [Dreissena polymorpha]
MSTSTLRQLIEQTIEGIPWQTKLQPTLPVEHVPHVLHEPAILTGYRLTGQSWKYYMYSLFQLHNESVNVWTHLIGCCILLHKLYGYFEEFNLHKDKVLTTLLVFGISCLICLFTSAMVHLLHSKSPHVHFVAFMIDYIGATIASFGAGIAGIYGNSEKAVYTALEPFYLPLMFVSSYLNFVNLCAAKIWYGHDPHNLKRKYMFILGMGIQAIINMAPFAPRYVTCYCDATCSLTSLNLLTTIQIVFILEALAFAAHQPEKTWPGKFDIFGHGHQIFHVLIVVNHVLQLESIYSDHVSGLTNHSEPGLLTITITMVVLYLAEAVTLYFMCGHVGSCLQRVEALNGKKCH